MPLTPDKLVEFELLPSTAPWRLASAAAERIQTTIRDDKDFLRIFDFDIDASNAEVQDVREDFETQLNTVEQFLLDLRERNVFLAQTLLIAAILGNLTDEQSGNAGANKANLPGEDILRGVEILHKAGCLSGDIDEGSLPTGLARLIAEDSQFGALLLRFREAELLDFDAESPSAELFLTQLEEVRKFAKERRSQLIGQARQALWPLWRERLAAYVARGETRFDANEADVIGLAVNMEPATLFEMDLSRMTVRQWSSLFCRALRFGDTPRQDGGGLWLIVPAAAALNLGWIVLQLRSIVEYLHAMGPTAASLIFSLFEQVLPGRDRDQNDLFLTFAGLHATSRQEAFANSANRIQSIIVSAEDPAFVPNWIHEGDAPVIHLTSSQLPEFVRFLRNINRSVFIGKSRLAVLLSLVGSLGITRFTPTALLATVFAALLSARAPADFLRRRQVRPEFRFAVIADRNDKGDEKNAEAWLRRLGGEPEHLTVFVRDEGLDAALTRLAKQSSK